MNATASFTPTPSDDVAWLGDGPIPAKPYYDPEWFALEREAVFRRSWIVVGHVCELPKSGSFMRRELEVADVSLLITRGKDGRVRAFHNVCTHRGTQLVAEAEGQRATFSCRYHMWTFDTEGALLSAPDFDGFNTTKDKCALPVVRVEVVAGLIFVNLWKDAPPLREELGDFADEMETLPVAKATHFSEYCYEIDSNWKLAYDNFQENYHLRFIHPRSGAQGTGQENPFGYPTRYRFFGPHRGQSIWTNPASTARGPVQATAMGNLMGTQAKRGLIPAPHAKEYFALFPNFFMFGSPIQNFSHVVYPLTVGRSRGVIRLYWVDQPENAAEAFGRAYALTMQRDLHSEDVEVIEAGYRGLAGGALEHIHFQTQEVLCRHLYENVASRVALFRDAEARP